MKVLQLGPYPPPHGGIQTHIVALREMLRQRHIPCAVVNLTRTRRPSSDEVFYPSSGLQVLWLLLRRRYDILHLHIGGRVWPRQLALGIFCSILPGRKSVLTFHSGGYPSSSEGISTTPRSLRAWVFRRFDRIIAVNAQIAAFFERTGVRPERIRLISPHSLPSIHAGDSVDLPPAVESFFRDHHPLIITVGLLEKEYDLPLQIAALVRIQEKWPTAGLLIAGSGSLYDSLRKQMETQSYAEHILLYGDLPHAATLQAITRADLMLRTTWYDGDALSVREALHFGLPVVATDNGMRPEGVHLIPARDLEALLAAIEDVLRNPPPRVQPAAQTEDGNLLAVLELYQELASQSRTTEDAMSNEQEQ
jgi:glycosyltransferase involved in cell wall biosynthesis